MQKHKILIAMRDPRHGWGLAENLNRNGFEAENVFSASDLYEKNKNQPFYGLVVDIALNREAPDTFIQGLRSYGRGVPILVILELDDLADATSCVNLDIDDFIVKSVNPFELDARLKFILKRAGNQKPVHSKLRFGDLVLDQTQRSVIGPNNEPISLTLAEFNLTWALASSGGKVLSRDDLIRRMSLGSAPVSIRAIDILISRIRKKLGKEAVLTVSKVGYKGGWPVSVLDASSV